VTTGLSRDSWHGQRIGDALALEIDDGVMDGLVEGHAPHAAQTCPDARDLSSGRLKRPNASRLRGRLRQLQDDVTVALARAAQEAEAAENSRVEPDQALAALVGRVLVADTAERHRARDRLERLNGNCNPDHLNVIWGGPTVGSTLNVVAQRP
jgi:hypothetical protein